MSGSDHTSIIQHLTAITDHLSRLSTHFGDQYRLIITDDPALVDLRAIITITINPHLHLVLCEAP